MAMYPGMYGAPDDSLRTVSAEMLLQELRSDVVVVIIDVRDRHQLHQTGAIPDARMYPLHELGLRLAELVDLRATRVVVVSQREGRSRRAAHELEAAGFEEVFVLEGGMQAWLELGYPVEARPDSSPPPSIRP